MQKKYQSFKEHNNKNQQPGCLSIMAICQQILSLRHTVQQLKFQIEIIQANLSKFTQLLSLDIQKIKQINNFPIVNLKQALQLKELRQKFAMLQSKLNESAQREQIIMYDIDSLSKRLITLQSQSIARAQLQNLDELEISSIVCSQPHCRTKFQMPSSKVYHNKTVHFRKYQI